MLALVPGSHHPRKENASFSQWEKTVLRLGRRSGTGLLRKLSCCVVLVFDTCELLYYQKQAATKAQGIEGLAILERGDTWADFS